MELLLHGLYVSRIPLLLFLICVATIQSVRSKVFLRYTKAIDALVTKVEVQPRRTWVSRYRTLLQVDALTAGHQQYVISVEGKHRVHVGDQIGILVDPCKRYPAVWEKHLPYPKWLAVLYLIALLSGMVATGLFYGSLSAPIP